MLTTDPELERALDRLAMPGVLIGHRLIGAGDALALLPEEQGAFAGSVDKVKQASGAARLVARGLMKQLGMPDQPILKSAAGAPQWPPGLIGSLAHDARVAAAAIARRGALQSLGIDVEPAEPLDMELADLIAKPSEQLWLARDPLQYRLLFAIKEAVYKCVFPLDGVFLEHHDVEVDLAASTAMTQTGRSVRFRHSLSSHIAVLAFI